MKQITTYQITLSWEEGMPKKHRWEVPCSNQYTNSYETSNPGYSCILYSLNLTCEIRSHALALCMYMHVAIVSPLASVQFNPKQLHHADVYRKNVRGSSLTILLHRQKSPSYSASQTSAWHTALIQLGRAGRL